MSESTEKSRLSLFMSAVLLPCPVSKEGSLSGLLAGLITILSVDCDSNPVKQAKGGFFFLTHIKGTSNGLQVWLDPGTEAILAGLPPYSALYLSVSLLGSIIFFLILDNFSPPGLNMAPVPKTAS